MEPLCGPIKPMWYHLSYKINQVIYPMKRLYKITLILAASAMFAQAADFRTWTSRRGRSIEAQLMQYKEGSVKLVTKEPKELVLKVTDLCLADRQYLIEYADAKADVILKGSPEIPEHDYKKEKSFLTKLDKKLSFGQSSSLIFDVYESEHFVYAVGKGVRVTGLAETAESCWHGMAFQHFEFRENWGDSRLLIVIPGEKDAYSELGKYEAATLEKMGQGEHAANVKLTWERVGATGVTVDSDNMEEFNVKGRASVFNVEDTKKFRRKFDSFQTHVVCGRLFSEQVGRVSSISGAGYFALSTGHAYYKEIQLTKKTETNLISSDYGGDIATKSGFEDGSSWPKLLKKMVKKGDVKLNLMATLGIKSASDLTPKSLVTMYSLSCYMQSSQQRIASYAKLARLINTSDQIPETTELVKIFGFDSIKEFEADWTEFVSSRDFK